MDKKNRSWENRYEVIKEIGEGGNAKVYLVRSRKDSKEYALKDLMNSGREKKARFKDEIDVMSLNKDDDGIMPLVDFSKEEFWYVMPVAKPIFQHIKENSLEFKEILSLCISFAKVLKEMHSKDIIHRDIKPFNLYWLDEKCVFGDFGLADFPERENNFTRSDRGLGAIFTIAPEMKRNPSEADGKKADVFSFAKTMWMFFSDEEKGFDGSYDENNPSISLSYRDQYRGTHLVELEKLLSDATDSDPNNRPSMEELHFRLEDFKQILDDPVRSQESDWSDLSNTIFGEYSPRSAKWCATSIIIKVLNLIGRKPVYNHMFFSCGGGLDFKMAEDSNEEGWIYIYDTYGYCHLVKPKFLYFEKFEEKYTCNYFLLELEDTEPIETIPDGLEYEFLIEDYPGHFVSARDSIYGVYDYDTGVKLPKGYKKVHRYFTGKILIVFKQGLYNSIFNTYDGRHGEFTNEEFRRYIEDMIKIEKKAILLGKDPKQVLNSEFDKNPFEPSKKEPIADREEWTSEADEIKEFIEKKIAGWQIDLPDYNVTGDEYVKFSFRLTPNPRDVFKKQWVLGKNGRFGKEDIADTEVYFISVREKSIDFRSYLEQFVTDKLKEADLMVKTIDSYVSIEMKMLKNPTHLFTYDEMIDKMRAADDRHNNRMVIDGNGEIQIIKGSDFFNQDLYPVYAETWCAGNNYVGKYADLSNQTQLYKNCLRQWDDYLTTGRHRYVVFYEDIKETEEELIALIKDKMK